MYDENDMGIKKLNKKRKRCIRAAQQCVGLSEKVKLQEKTIFDLGQLLEISNSLNSMIEFRRLMEAILYVVMAQMKTFGVAIFTKKTFDDDSFILYDDVYGFDTGDYEKLPILDAHKIIQFLASKDRCVLPEEIKDAFSDGRDSDRAVKLLLDLGASLFVPMKVRKHLVGFLILGKQIEGTCAYDAYAQDMILNIANLAAIAINNAQLLEMTTTDMMTRLKLKHYFFAVLSEQLEDLDPQSNLSVLMFDLDNFKGVNDTYGHECGDIVLQQVADVIKTSIRDTDLAARYGGEEFVAMLPGADIDVAVMIAERIRSRIEAMEIIYDNQSVKITISIGIAQYLHDKENTKSLVNRSDVALYTSKRTGKNKYSISEKNLKALEAENAEAKTSVKDAPSKNKKTTKTENTNSQG